MVYHRGGYNMDIIKVCVLVSGLDSENSRKLYKGIRHQAKLAGFATYVCMTRPYKEGNKESFEGEFNLFKQINYNSFDALIVVLNTFDLKEVKNLILQKCNTIKKPVIAIDCDIEGAYKISSSNYEAQRALMEHLVHVHGYRKINYISGPLENGEARRRLMAYEDVLKEQGLYDEKRIYHGTFFLQDGKAALDYFESDKEVSDCEVIVCANDMSALSLMEELEKRGKNIPKDVAVTGLDDIEDAKAFYPGLTTVSKMNYEMGVLAVKQLQCILEGKEVDRQSKLLPHCVFRGSCGCKMQNNAPAVNISTQNFTRQVFTTHMIKYFLENSSMANTFDDFSVSIAKFLELIEQPMFLLCINENFEKIFGLEDMPSLAMPGLIEGKRYKVFFYHALENAVEIKAIRDRKKLTEWFYSEPKEILSSPIHFRGEDYGFLIFEGAAFPFMGDLYWEWLNALRTSIHILYDRLQMDDFYRRDSLTNLYNRKGLEYYWRRFLKVSEKRKRSIMVMFVDLDRLKYINDNFGHEQGDYAIRAVANALAELEPTKCVASRYGGDEFVLLAINCNEEIAEQYKKEIEQKLQTVNQRGLPYMVSASIGYMIRNSKSEMTLDACMKVADKKMFEEKCVKHKQQKNDI